VLPVVLVLMVVLAGGGLTGFFLFRKASWSEKTYRSGYAPRYDYGADGRIQFKDDVQSQTRPGTTALDAVLVDSQGRRLDLKRYRGKKNVVLVVMRGFDGMVCLGCRAQTSSLISRHAEFVQRDAEVLVVYPGERRHLDEFLKKAQEDAANVRPPFPVVLDEDLELVDRFDIRDRLAKPATYILDKQGRVRFTYVGTDRADRPSVKAMLDQLDALSAP
jgi:peroxiredoxin